MGKPSKIVFRDDFPCFCRSWSQAHGRNLRVNGLIPNPESSQRWRLTRYARPLTLPPNSTHPGRTLDLKEIRKIVELMNDHDLTLFHLEKEDFNLKLKKGADAEAIREALGGLSVASPAALPANAPSAPGAAPVSEAPAEENGRAIESPMVGTFYSKPTPDADSFVEVGDKISEGQVLCIIEAMKVMNEIKAETSGTITEVCVEDSSPVQYGDALFRVT